MTSEAARVEALAGQWPDETRDAWLDYLSTASRREIIKDAYSDAADLARALDPNYRITPAVALIARNIETALTEPHHNLLVSTPPQEGKTSLCAVYAPLRALQLNRDARIILASYSSELAQDASRRCRELINTHGSGIADPLTGKVMDDKLGYQLAPGSNKMSSWKLRGARGGMVAVGLGASITGRSADCVTGDTYILTDYGVVTAERAHREQHAWIWAYDHAQAVAGWHRVDASRRIDGRGVVTVTTQSGRVLRCTPDHRVYTRRGYIRAGDLEPLSDAVLSFSGAGGVHPVPDNIPDDGRRYPQGDPPAPESVLLGHVCEAPKQRPAAAASLPDMRGPDSAFTQGDVFTGVPEAVFRREADDTNLPYVLGRVQADIVADNVLRPALCGRGALAADDRRGQLAFQDRSQLREVVPADAPDDSGARRVSVRGVRAVASAGGVYAPRQADDEIAVDRSPHQRPTGRQPARKPNHHVRNMPRGSSQIGYDTVSSVVADSVRTHSVYDFQVAGARNFFADGLLAHNCLIIDDPIKNPMEADSANHRRKVANWFSQVARTRLSPRASMVLVMTRWHPDDLAGRILADELGRDPRFRTWKHINIPAISEEGIRDDLGRAPGVAMVSARGRTKQEFEQTRREVGDRTWFSMYQGVPRNPEGGLFTRAWFEPPADTPADAVATVVGVDPADSGHDDDTGIIAAALTGTGTVVFTDDWSGKFTSDQWSRRAVLLALTVGAREIGLEAYSAAATYENALKAAYRAIHTDALTKRRTGADLTLIESRALSETPPFLVYKWRAGARIDAVGRSALLRQALETRRARVVEHKMANLIEDAADWQVGQHCPDRVAAAVIAHDRLAVLGSGRMTVAAPVDRPNEQVVPFRRPGTGGEGFRRRLRRP